MKNIEKGKTVEKKCSLGGALETWHSRFLHNINSAEAVSQV